MVEVLGMLDLTLDRVRLGSSAPTSGRAREAPASGYRALSHVVFYLSALRPARTCVATVEGPRSDRGGFALYTQGTCPGTPAGARGLR
jgi:hypothetical protein